MPALATNLVSDFQTLAALAPQWWDLWERSPYATPFQSPAWLLSWWEEFRPGDLLCGVATAEGRLKALFPFYLEEREGGPRLLPIGISLSDYLDVLVDAQCPEAAHAVTKLMCEARWASWSFEEMPPGAAAASLPRPASCLEKMSPQETCPVLQLLEGCDLESCVPARRRRQLRRAHVIAATLGEPHISRCEQDSQHFLDVLFDLHRSRWRERDEAGVLADAQVQNFHRAVLPRLAAAGLARCYLLALGHRPIAAYYGLLHRGRAYAYLGGFDPAFAEASPGAILIGQAIVDAISEGVSEFHFLRGREAYKYGWGARDRWNSRRVWVKGLVDA
jgi:CelD/BcsL family acetyltransferase involved in cellulose biosynthesis